MTSNLEKRVYEHENKSIKSSFSAKYNLDKLLYWELSEDINATSKEKSNSKNGVELGKKI